MPAPSTAWTALGDKLSVSSAATESGATAVLISSDTFGRHDTGKSLQSHIADSDATWIKHPGQATANALIGTGIGDENDCYNEAVSGVEYILSPASPSADMFSQARMFMLTSMIGANDGMGITVRHHRTVQTRYLAMWGNLNTRWEVYRDVAGAFTLLGTSSSSQLGVGSSRTMRFSAQGEGSCVTLIVAADGVSILTIADTAASRITATGHAGIRFFNVAVGSTSNSKLHLSAFTAATISSIVTSIVTTPIWSTQSPSAGTWNAHARPSVATWSTL